MELAWGFGSLDLSFPIKFFFIIFNLLLLSVVEAKRLPLPAIKGSDEKNIDDYTKVHDLFSKTVCRPGVEQEFWKLNHAFRGDGHYIPLTTEDKLDSATIVKHLPELRKKLVWIDRNIENLRKLSSMSKALKELADLESMLKELLVLKHKFYQSQKPEQKKKLEIESRLKFNQFNSALKSFFDSIFFLQSYNFPIDHFALRQEFDRWKSSLVPKERLKSNDVYFYRQIVQDGAQDPDHKRSDRFLRSVLDTVYLETDRHVSAFISEDLRYDLNTVFSLSKIQLMRGTQNQLSRMEEWRERTHRAIMFYTGLLNNKIERDGATESGEQVVNQLTQARYALKEYNFQRQKEVYEFWRKQSELMKALFSIETILYNEVGSIDGREGLERKDVTQIVLNRFQHSFYSSLEERDGLYPFLNSIKKEEIALERWLNLLFKEGEFSFTYFFINSSVRVYCPDKSRTGRWLRRQNLKIALEGLRAEDSDFEALRYYSRHSMQGRMRMDLLWSDYEAIAERPGVEMRKSQSLKKRHQADDFQFLYNFNDPTGVGYQVLEIAEDVVTYREKDGAFFTWRNPHLFRYFSPVASKR
jgi:hypothetical protein